MNSQLTDQRRARQARKLAQRREKLRIFTWGVAIPTLIALVYYLIVARPNYEVTMKFTVQGLHQNRPDFLTGIGIPAITPATNDGRIIVEYLKSTEAVRNLRRAHGFNDAYGGFTLDPMGFVSPGASIEKATRFWNSKAVVTYDATSNVVTADISAFSPEMSLKLARGTLDEATKVVNSLNSRVQNEATKAAEREMDRKKAEYEAVRDRMTRLRAGQALTLDAEQQQVMSMVARAEEQLATLRVERAASAATFQPDSPQIKAINEKIAALEMERGRAMAQLTSGPGTGEARRDVSGQTMMLDYEFAQKAYYAAVTAHQQTISTRDNERRYLVAFVPPRAPETSDYWSRLANVLAVAVISALLMAIVSLSYSVIKDHMQ